jgi:hypothetical protein
MKVYMRLSSPLEHNSLRVNWGQNCTEQALQKKETCIFCNDHAISVLFRTLGIID